MALGGGIFTNQNKELPGAYINFISAASAGSSLSDRGIATMPLELDWGISGEIFEVTNEEFRENSREIFGYSYDHESLKGLRDLFLNARILYVYRLNGGEKVQNGFNVANGGFDSFGDAVANLIGQIISWFLSLGKIVTRIIDAIFGTSWTDGLSSLQDSVLGWGKNDKAITIDRKAPAIDYRMEYEDAFETGANWGDGVSNKVSGFFSGLTGGAGEEFENQYHVKPYNGEQEDSFGYSGGGGMGSDAAKTAANTGETAANTAVMADSLDVTNEQLKYLRDIAERDTIKRFTTASIKVEMTNHNNVNSSMDLDGVVDGLANGVMNAMSKTAEGVHI